MAIPPTTKVMGIFAINFMKWDIKQIPKQLPKLKNPIFIGGLPGIGNVGKVVVDFMIDKLDAKRLYEISSYSFPPSVYINEENLVELPSIEIYYKKFKNKKNDLLFLAGDVQPIDEESSYTFSDKILDIAEHFGCTELITLAGIGLPNIPKKPVVYCTANSKKIIEKYKKSTSLNPNSYGVVGPIIGVSGLLVGLAGKRKISGISILAETFGHPMYLGVKGAREILKILNQKLELNISLKDLDKEIMEIEEEIRKIKGIDSLPESFKKPKETSYIG